MVSLRFFIIQFFIKLYFLPFGLPLFKFFFYFLIQECEKLKRSPYCCNGCKEKSFCSLLKKYYYADNAETVYRQVLIEKRKGFCITEEEAESIGKYLKPLIEKDSQQRKNNRSSSLSVKPTKLTSLSLPQNTLFPRTKFYRFLPQN